LDGGPTYRNNGSLLFKEMQGGDLFWATEYSMPYMQKYLPCKVPWFFGSGARCNWQEQWLAKSSKISIWRLTKSTVTEVICKSRKNMDLLDPLESQLNNRMLSEPDCPKRKKIAVDMPPTVVALATRSLQHSNWYQQPHNWYWGRRL